MVPHLVKHTHYHVHHPWLKTLVLQVHECGGAMLQMFLLITDSKQFHQLLLNLYHTVY